MDNLLSFFKNLKLPSFKRPSLPQLIFWAAMFVFAIGIFVFIRNFTACWTLTSLPGIPLPSCSGGGSTAYGPTLVNSTGTPQAMDLPAPPIPVEEAPKWDGGSRINILFIGLRAGGASTSEADCPLCTDTLILLTLDPTSKTAGILSIPRDLWVNIPGFGYSRINTAYTSGEASKLPGGGPGLTMKTVSQTIGVPVNYYVWVDFNTFISIINMIGGVDVQNYEKLRLDPIGDGKDKVIITPGLRHLDGQLALAYARCRTQDECGAVGGDSDRSKRQQLVILAIRDKVFDPANFPNLIAQAPKLYQTFGEGIHTNISLADAIKLAYLAKDVDPSRIKTAIIDTSMVVFENTTLAGQAASVMRPQPDKIRLLVEQMFTGGRIASPLANKGDPNALMQADGARILITNDTYTAQLESRTANYLVSQKMNVIGFGQQTGVLNQTTIVVYSPKLYALQYLIKALGITSPNQIRFRVIPNPPADLEVDLGVDWVSKLPAGF